jgi:hypothetical protein
MPLDKMNMPAAPISFASAYRQLRPTEKAFVDGYVADVEREANRKAERISLALHRAIPSHVVEASRGMLDRPMVRAAITERINDLAAASELTVHRVIKELMGVAFASVGDYMQVGEDGQPWFDLARCTPEQLASIKSIKIEESGGGDLSRPNRRKFEFVLHDKLAGIKMLADYMGLLERDNPHWRQDQARPVQQPALPATMTTDGAADVYSQMING